MIQIETLLVFPRKSAGAPVILRCSSTYLLFKEALQHTETNLTIGGRASTIALYLWHELHLQHGRGEGTAEPFSRYIEGKAGPEGALYTLSSWRHMTE